MSIDYQQHGYAIVPSLYGGNELNTLNNILMVFHQKWLADNQEFYHERAINSAYLTRPGYLNDEQRLGLFQFMGQKKLTTLIEQISHPTMFMGTQLFFDPHNSNQPNYWHRDGQYNGDLEYQKAALNGPQVLHIRVPLVDETGVELVPGSHARWDTPQELETRYEENGRRVFDDLPNTHKIELKRGDALIFSANMLHRGLYANAPNAPHSANSRFALDILFCDAVPKLAKFTPADVLPDQAMYAKIEDAEVYQGCKKL